MYDGYFSWGVETVWGTAVARTQHARAYAGTNLKHEKPSQPLSFLADRDADAPFFLAERGVGTFEVPLVYDGNGLLLEHAMGAATVDAGASPFTHTHSLDNNPYTRAAAPHIGLTFEHHVAAPDAALESFVLHGGRVASFGMSFSRNEEVRMTGALIGQKVLQAAKTASPTYPDYDSAAASPLVKPTQIALTIGGSGSTVVNSADFTCNNGLNDSRAHIGSQFISEPRAVGKRDITGTINLEWLTKTEYDKFVAGTASALIITCTGTGTDTLVITLANIFYNGETPSGEEGETLDYNLPFKAYDDDTTGALHIVETNLTAVT